MDTSKIKYIVIVVLIIVLTLVSAFIVIPNIFWRLFAI